MKSGCKMTARVICRYASFFCIPSFVARCCRDIQNSLGKEVFDFLRSLW